MAITGLTDRTPSFKEIARLRLGIPKSEALVSGPQEISYFRPDFRPDALDAATDFMTFYGPKPDRVTIRLPFTQIDRCWDAFYEVYNKTGMLGMADGKKWLYLRSNQTGELLVKDGVPTNATGLPVDENGMAYLPFDKTVPVYSYKSKKGEDVAVFAKPTGRLKVLIPVLKRAAYVLVITHSVYNIMRISEQLAGVAAIAQSAGMTLPMVPMVLSRRLENISVSIKGRKSMQDHYLLNIEIDPVWMSAQFDFLNTLMPGKTVVPLALAPKIEAVAPEDLSESNGEEYAEPDNQSEPEQPDEQPEPEVQTDSIPAADDIAWPAAVLSDCVKNRWVSTETKAAEVLGRSKFVTPQTDPEYLKRWVSYYVAQRKSQDQNGAVEYADQTVANLISNGK